MDNTIYRPIVNSITDKDWEYYLSFSPWKFIQITSESLKNSNRFFVDERFTKLIFWFIFGQESRYEAQHLVRPNQCLYRARIYDNTNVLTDNRFFSQSGFVIAERNCCGPFASRQGNNPLCPVMSDIDSSVKIAPIWKSHKPGNGPPSPNFSSNSPFIRYFNSLITS